MTPSCRSRTAALRAANFVQLRCAESGAEAGNFLAHQLPGAGAACVRFSIAALASPSLTIISDSGSVATNAMRFQKGASVARRY
jgi:hypothetical protein